MTIEIIRNTLLYSAIINYVLIFVWYFLIRAPHGWMMAVMGKNFHITAEECDAIMFKGIAFYKMGNLLFCLVPYIALRLAS